MKLTLIFLLFLLTGHAVAERRMEIVRYVKCLKHEENEKTAGNEIHKIQKRFQQLVMEMKRYKSPIIEPDTIKLDFLENCVAFKNESTQGLIGFSKQVKLIDGVLPVRQLVGDEE